MARKTRSDIKVGNLEKKLGLGPGAIKNPDGTDARSDKKLKTLRTDFDKAAKPSRKTSKNTVAKKVVRKKPPIVKKVAVTADEQIAALRKVKRNPKVPSSIANVVRASLNKGTKK